MFIMNYGDKQALFNDEFIYNGHENIKDVEYRYILELPNDHLNGIVRIENYYYVGSWSQNYLVFNVKPYNPNTLFFEPYTIYRYFNALHNRGYFKSEDVEAIITKSGDTPLNMLEDILRKGYKNGGINDY